MIFLTLLVVLFFSISSVSSQSVADLDDINQIKESKVLKSNSLSSSKSTETALSATNKSNATKVTNASKTSENDKTKNKTVSKANATSKTAAKKANTTTVNKKTLAKTSTSFMNSVEKNGKFPKVKISNRNYSNTEYLYLLSKAVENNSNSKIEMKNNLVKPYNNTKCKSVKGTINKTEYVKIASKTRKFIEKNHRAPNWASSSKGNIPYNQLILLYSKCLDNYNKTNKLPSSVKLDNLDLDIIKNKINKKTVKSTSNDSAKKTNATIAKKTNSSTKANTTTSKKTNSSVKKTNTTKTTVKTNGTATVKNKANNTNSNVSLVEKSLDYINSIINNILDKLDPSKYQIDITQSDEANVKLNTSKVNVDVNGKSTLNVKVSAKNSTKTTKKANETSSAKKTSTATAKKTTANKTSTAKKTASKTTKAKTTSNAISKALKEYLSSSKNCQVNNKQIKELAKKLTSSLKTDHQKGKKLFAWVRDNIQYKKYSNTRRGALKTLQSKKGNCVDQAHLLIALSRAAGIPARYVNGGNCKFTTGYVGGHVWTQLYINKKWVVADTTSSRNSLGKIRNWNTKSYKLYGKYSSISF